MTSNRGEIVEATLSKAAEYLIQRWEQLAFTTHSEELLEIVTGSMRTLCTLKGVNPAIASAVVAAWTPVGIFQSDELVKNLMGKDVESDDAWAFYRRFYLQAIEALKILRQTIAIEILGGWGRIDTGEELEKAAWCIYHARPSPPRIRYSNGRRRSSSSPDSDEFFDQETTDEEAFDWTSEEEWEPYLRENYDIPKKPKSKKRKTKEDWIEEAKQVAAERGEEDGRRHSKRLKGASQGTASNRQSASTS